MGNEGTSRRRREVVALHHVEARSEHVCHGVLIHGATVLEEEVVAGVKSFLAVRGEPSHRHA